MTSTATTAHAARSKETVLESKGLLQAILSFVPGTCRFTAAVNHNFYQNYLKLHHANKDTSIPNALQAVGTALIWAAERRYRWEGRLILRDTALHSFPRDTAAFPCDTAAWHGSLAVVQGLRQRG
jgi:hypothetical protein